MDQSQWDGCLVESGTLVDSFDKASKSSLRIWMRRQTRTLAKHSLSKSSEYVVIEILSISAERCGGGKKQVSR